MTAKLHIILLTLCHVMWTPLVVYTQKVSKTHNHYIPDTAWDDQLLEFTEKCSANNNPRVFSVRAEDSQSYVEEGTGNTVIQTNRQTRLRLSGINLNNDGIEIGLTPIPGKAGDQCYRDSVLSAITERVDNNTAILRVTINVSDNYYICIVDVCSTDLLDSYTHQSVQPWLTITAADSTHFPFWLQILLIVTLLVLSSLLSGLNIGLLSLDLNELKVLATCGTKHKKELAKTILPVRQRSNYLLCSILLGNVLVNTTVTILLDEITSAGIIAIAVSTIGIVIFGEIIPTAICSRRDSGLAIGGRTVFITYMLMFVTFPLSYPLSKILDIALGEEVGSVYDREGLIEYIRITKKHNKLKPYEMNIICQTLKLNRISVLEVMTPIRDTYMLPIDTILNAYTLNQISKIGYNRIPIYDTHRTNLVSVIDTNDLITINGDHNLCVKQLIELKKRSVFYVYSHTTLDVMLNEFRLGLPRIAFVRHYSNEPNVCVGIVTLNDVFDALIQSNPNNDYTYINNNNSISYYTRNIISNTMSSHIRTISYSQYSNNNIDVIRNNEKNLSI